MDDFIVTSPFNGFPILFDKTRIYTTDWHSWTLTREEAMRFFWFSQIDNLLVDINIDMADNYGNQIHINKNFDAVMSRSMFGQDGRNYEPYERVTATISTGYMYEFDGDEEDLFEFDITLPRYTSDDEYVVTFIGVHSFTEESVNYNLYFGYSPSDTSYIQKYDFSLIIFDKEIPCSLVQRSSSSYDISLSVTASISSSYLA